MNKIADDILMHYGMKKRSGRYPWGSGENPYQHSGDFLSRVEELERSGKSELEICRELRISTTDFRMQKRVAKHERRALEADRARSLRDDGKSLNEIAAIMGYNSDSSIRALLNENTANNKNKAMATADILKKQVDEKGMVDVGIGVERELGVSQNTLQEALFILETQGYHRYPVGIPQVTNPGKQINTQILCRPEIEEKEPYQRMEDIKPYSDDYKSDDGGLTYRKSKVEYPASIDSDRVFVRYADDGGLDKDGLIELRRGVADLNLGNSHYAQVRILVDGTHYLKGMAMYSDDIPDGVDIVYNTNKKSDVPKEKVFKEIDTADPNNPFGATIKENGQSKYIDKDGVERLSPINKLKEEGDWDAMSRNLSSQFLSKQPIALIKKQLALTYDDAVADYDEICALTNPTVKRKMLLEFADELDSAVVHMKAAALPRQSTQVILPITAMKEDEIYAPNYENGEQVALVRYPHAGTFEIPILTVNNKNRSAREILTPNIKDAVGINPEVAKRLSGADFDGDQVIVIPTNDKSHIKSTPALEKLKDFEPKEMYPERPGMKYMKDSDVQKQMGAISNLITDMTLRGADENEIVRAVKHSMVVIDAKKHKLDYIQSEKDNGIAELKKKYQGYTTDDGREVGGASTLLSRRKQTVEVPERQGSGHIDPETGKMVYKESGRTYEVKKKKIDPDTGKVTYEKTGTYKKATTKVPLLSVTDDLRKLSSGTPAENIYADHGNKLKALANKARLEYLKTPRLKQSSSAKAAYEKVVSVLEAKLNLAQLNAPREREAQRIANAKVKAQKQANPDLANDKKEIKKISSRAISEARYAVGASGKEKRITLTDQEWEAIQAGAVSDSKLTEILRYADPDDIKKRATPKASSVLSQTKINRIKSLSANGYTNSEIANVMGLSTSTISKYIGG